MISFVWIIHEFEKLGVTGVTVADTTHPQSNKLTMGVKIKAAGELTVKTLCITGA